MTAIQRPMPKMNQDNLDSSYGYLNMKQLLSWTYDLSNKIDTDLIKLLIGLASKVRA